MSPRKEPLFFTPDLPGLPGDRIGDPHVYLALFKDATDQRRIGEASPDHLYSAHASDAIGRQCQDARIIIMLRNPADMMYSMYWAWSYAGFEDSPSFEAAIDREPDQDGTQGRFILNYRRLTRYYEHVQRYLGAVRRLPSARDRVRRPRPRSRRGPIGTCVSSWTLPWILSRDLR